MKVQDIDWSAYKANVEQAILNELIWKIGGNPFGDENISKLKQELDYLTNQDYVGLMAYLRENGSISILNDFMYERGTNIEDICDVRNTFFDKNEQATYIDAYFSDDDEDEGVVVAKVHTNTTIEWIVPQAQNSRLVMDKIKEVQTRIIDKWHTTIHQQEDVLRKLVKDLCAEIISQGISFKQYDIDISYMGTYTSLQSMYYIDELNEIIELSTCHFNLSLEELEFDQLYNLYNVLSKIV